jgi:hypothetical protein
VRFRYLLFLDIPRTLQVRNRDHGPNTGNQCQFLGVSQGVAPMQVGGNRNAKIVLLDLMGSTTSTGAMAYWTLRLWHLLVRRTSTKHKLPLRL